MINVCLWNQSMFTNNAKLKLPLYGPLEIQNIKDFLDKSKKQFVEEYNKLVLPSVTIDMFHILNTLARGNFGVVKLVQNKSDKSYYAMKVLEKLHMDHFSKDSTYIYFLMPFISGGDMFIHLSTLGKFNEDLSRFYAAQVVLALEYLQYLCLVYRDLKPENILLDYLGFLKLTDFGFTKLVKSRTYTFCGTPQYIAPEIIQGLGYARSVDWWSLGVLIFEMNAGFLPFEAKNKITLYTKIMYDSLYIPNSFSFELKNILENLIQRDVTRRIGNLKNGASDVKAHKWFKKINWLKLLNRNISPSFVPKSYSFKDDGLSDNRNIPELIVEQIDVFVEEFKDF